MPPRPHVTTRRRLVHAGIASLFGGLAGHRSAPVLAQGAPADGALRFPERPVRVIVPQPPGGAADRLARFMAERLESRWKQPVVVENRPGGGVIVGTATIVRAAPDGHTIGLLGSSLSINAVQRKDLPYDVTRDLQPIARVGYWTVVLVATPDFPANDIAGLIAFARKRPGTLSFGSNGIGTSAQLAGELLNHMAGLDMVHVPYNGAAPMLADLLGKRIPIGFGVAGSAEPFVRAGQLKVLGVTSLTRSRLYPDWPAIAETLPGFEAANWAGFCGPAGIPPALTARLADDILVLLATPDTAKSLAAMGIDVAPQGPEAFAAFIRSEMKRFAEITKPLAGLAGLGK